MYGLYVCMCSDSRQSEVEYTQRHMGYTHLDEPLHVHYIKVLTQQSTIVSMSAHTHARTHARTHTHTHMYECT